jgi:dTDP-4-dehydrorhamnose reductase
LPGAHVVRTAWVYTGVGGDFVAAMASKADEAEPLEVVADQIGSPTYVADLVSALLQLVAGEITAPLLHAANAGAASRYEQARAVFETIGADPDRILPVPTDRYRRPAPRPAYSALSSRESAGAGLTPLRPWRDALAEALSAG